MKLVILKTGKYTFEINILFPILIVLTLFRFVDPSLPPFLLGGLHGITIVFSVIINIFFDNVHIYEPNGTAYNVGFILGWIVTNTCFEGGKNK